MHLLLNFDKLKKILLKNYFLRIKAQLQQKNAQLQEQNNHLQQTNAQLQQQNNHLQQTTSQLQEQNIQLQELITHINSYDNRDYEEITYHYYINNNINPHVPAPSIPTNSFNGSQLLALYNIPKISPSNINTRKVKIGVIVAYSHKNIKNDLKTYWQSFSNFGPTSSPPNINVYTFPGTTTNVGWNIEECLDVQMVATVNPNADIWVVEAKSASLVDISNAIKYATNNLNVDVISMSFGAIDSTAFLSSNNLFINPTDSSKYKCFCASSGDDNAVCWPSVSTNIIAIGGTSLIWTPKKNNLYSRIEYTWEKAGCGYSKTVTKPMYQNSVNTKNNYRAVPDISLIANPNTGVKIVYNGKWYNMGGTSVGCPIFAGILSIANQQRFNLGKKPLTSIYSPNPSTNTNPSVIPVTNVQNHLYNTIYNNTTNRATCLTDVMIGNDGIYSAGIGYDMATGLGTPNATSLCNILTNNIS
jgi:subtilase family serine protease